MIPRERVISPLRPCSFCINYTVQEKKKKKGKINSTRQSERELVPLHEDEVVPRDRGFRRRTATNTFPDTGREVSGSTSDRQRNIFSVARDENLVK